MQRFFTRLFCLVLLICGAVALCACNANEGSPSSALPETDSSAPSESATESDVPIYLLDSKALSHDERLTQILIRNHSIMAASSPGLYVRNGWVLFGFSFFNENNDDIYQIELIDPATGEKIPESRISETDGVPWLEYCEDENLIYYGLYKGHLYELYFAAHMGNVHDIIIKGIGEDGKEIASYYFNFDEHCKGYIEKHVMGFENFPEWDAPEYDPDKYDKIY